jgi:succinate dehydrogenase / fumarate reductase, cytochrome b subunit
MANTLPDSPATSGRRPEFRNINALSDLPHYRLPAAGIVSILHRISGFVLFLLMPFVIWLFDVSVTSEISYESFRSAYMAGLGFLPAWFVKLVTLGLIWGYLQHFIAGVRHLWMDMTHSVSVAQGRTSAIATLVSSLLLTLLLGAKLFGLY